MKTNLNLSRREFLFNTGAAAGGLGLLGLSPFRALAGTPSSRHADLLALRRAIIDSPVSVGLHRARIFTRVFQKHEARPWIVRKALALREYFETVPLYRREHDGIAGCIGEQPGAMPVIVELGIGENDIYTGERVQRAGYLRGQVPEEIRDYWKNRNMHGLFRTKILRQPPFKSAGEVPQTLNYKFLSNQGHLSPSYGELLREGLGVVLRKTRDRAKGESDAGKLAFLEAAEQALAGLSAWVSRYAEFLSSESRRSRDSGLAGELREMSRIAGKVAIQPPETFREALQLIWFVHQSIHIEGHGYSCTPDHIDQLLLPFYEADRKAGRLDDAGALRLIENFVLKMYDNSFWGPEHHLTQGLCLGGSTADGRDLTNRLSRLFVEGATNLALPEPLLWIRWHPAIDQQFFDYCLSRLLKSTCFPMMWNDLAITEALMELGVQREDAFNYIAVGCNELAIPGQFYFNPCANVGYLQAIEDVLTGGRGYRRQRSGAQKTSALGELRTFDQFAAAVGSQMRTQIEKSYASGIQSLRAQMNWGQTPLTSCFFERCLEQAQDLTAGTKYNILSCGGIAFANAVDCLAAIREVVYRQKAATLDEVSAACAANFRGHERLRARLQAAPKQGNDDPALDDILRLVERLRDEPMKEICRDPRDGHAFGNCHVVRSSAIRSGLVTPATPDGRLNGAPLASSVAASVGCEHSGPTALLNSVCKLNSKSSWQTGYQVNIRFHSGMIANEAQRAKLRALLNTYFRKGGQELQINVVDSATLRAAQKNPGEYRDLVVRVAGFSEFFVHLTPEMQEEIIARAEYQ